MGYGDLQYYDIIIFAGIAAFLVFRLRKLLGKRAGQENNNKNKQNIKKNIIEKPLSNKDIPELENKISKLKKAYETINDFDHKKFLEGAKLAYETIINSFNKGDKKILKTLLTSEVFKVFEDAINEKKNNPNSQFFSLNIEEVLDVLIVSGLIKIKILFISEQFINEDESSIIKKRDEWVFEKQLSSKNPNWLLSAT